MNKLNVPEPLETPEIQDDTSKGYKFGSAKKTKGKKSKKSKGTPPWIKSKKK